ncbi:hypothetical protein P7C73_g3955, partial [Tremellales sp. Uapishka_1]
MADSTSALYDDDVDASELEEEDDVLDFSIGQEWGVDGAGSGGYWMREDWDGRVERTDSWERLENVTTRVGEKIPRLIHQTWKSDHLPDKWRKAWKECREGMPDYEYMLWTDETSREFIKTYYPSHLHMFDTYKYPIQRADSIRYFVLHHFGGIYMDLDIGCRRRMDGLLQGDWEVILPITKPVGVSNDLIFSSKGSAFMDDTVHGLSAFNHQFLSNYPTVMFSTGPMFLSAQYAIYSATHPLTPTHPRADIRILPKSLYGKNAPLLSVPHSFFSHFYGSSWHSDDAGFITFLGAWGKKLMYVGGVVILLGTIRLVYMKSSAKGGLRNVLQNQEYQLLSILPTSTSSAPYPSSGSGSSTPPSPTNTSSSLDSPSEITSALKKAGNLILAAPANLLSTNGNRRRSGLLYFVPAVFQPMPSPSRRSSSRRRTASEASQLPISRGRKHAPPPPYVPAPGNGMEEVDRFLLDESVHEGAGDSEETEDGRESDDTERGREGDTWQDWESERDQK